MTRWPRRSVISLLALGVPLLAGYWYMRGAPPLVDEVAYFPQIVNFTKGDFTLSPQLSPLPGYPGLMAAVAYLLGISSLPSLRFLTLFISAGSIVAFFLLNRSISERDDLRRTLTYATLPVVVPFFFLLYTDILSLAVVFASVVCLFRGRTKLSGLLGILSLLVRQTNILWLALMMAIVYYEAAGLRPSREGIRQVLAKCWVHLSGVGLFALFVIVNKGVAVHNKGAVPTMHFSTGNVFFALALFFFLFLPFHICRARRIVSLLRSKPWVFALIAGAFAFYMVTFKNTHPYNLWFEHYFLRNAALKAMTSSALAKSLAFLPIAWSLLSLGVTRLRRPSFYLLYPISLLFLATAWLIEPRYYVIPLSLFIAFREEESPTCDRATIIVNLLLAAALLYVTRRELFFL